MENLKVLTCGATAFDLCDSHYSGPFAMLLDQLARRFDVVLIDSPPVAFDTPTEVLARGGDGVLFVVKADGFAIRSIQRAKEQLERSGATLLGVILNQVVQTKGEYFSYDHRPNR